MGSKGKYPVNRFVATTPLSDCPLGGDITHDCNGCAYGADYHYEGGECVSRVDDECVVDDDEEV